MATTHFGFATIQTSQMNWDKDVNVNFGDIDFLLANSMKSLPGVPDIKQASIANFSPYVFGRARQGVYGLEVFEATDNFVPYADIFRDTEWTLFGSISVDNFDRFLGTKKITFNSDVAYAEVDFTTGAATENTVSFEGDATLEIYDGATLVATITSSPTTVTLTANTTYTLKVSGENKWVAHIQIEPLSYATPFSLKEYKRWDCNFVWNLPKPDKMIFNVRAIIGTPRAAGWGRIIYTDAFEVFFADDYSSLNLSVGADNTQYLYAFQQGREYLISAVTTADRVKVYVDQVLVMELEHDVTVGQFGFYNGVCNCHILGYGVDRYMGVENIAVPPLWVNCFTPQMPTVTNASYNAIQKDNVVLVDSSSGAVTVNLTPNIQRPGHILTVKDVGGQAGTNNITLQTWDGSTIDSQGNYVINTDYGKVTILFDGNNWFTI